MAQSMCSAKIFAPTQWPGEEHLKRLILINACCRISAKDYAVEGAMPNSKIHDTGVALRNAANDLLARMRNRWRYNNDLRIFNRYDSNEMDRMAREFGMNGSDLADLVARGPEAADLLYKRMRALSITQADVARMADGLMRDFEVTCSRCREKGTCEWDLANRPDDATWKAYCPNAVALEAVKKKAEPH
jgi:hypothetical protein